LWGFEALELICRFFADWGQGRPSTLLPRLVDVGADDSNLLARPTAVLAAIEAGDEVLAHRLIDRWGVTVKRDWTWQFVSWQWGLIATMIGRPDPYGPLAELRPIAGQLVTLGTGCVSWGTLNDVVARLLVRTGDPAGALAHAQAARDTHHRLGLPHLEQSSAKLVRELTS
jgi:hypothetical protein